MDPIFENNFTISAKIEIVILNDVIGVIEKKVRKKSTKLKKILTQKQKNELKLMLELDEIRSMDGDDTIYN